MPSGDKSSVLIRQWTLLNLLSKRVSKDANSLHIELAHRGIECSVRTVQRDLNSLEKIFPLVCIEGKPNSWRWAKNSSSAVLPGVEPAEAVTYQILEQFLGKYLPKVCIEPFEDRIQQSKSILEALDKSKLHRWPKKVKVVSRTQQLIAPEISPSIMETVNEALFQERKIKAKYKPVGKESKEYIINPLGLIISEPVIYLVATLWKYRDVKLLALHRLSDIEILEEKTKVPKGFDMDELVNSGILGFSKTPGKMIELTAIFNQGAAEHLKETPLSEDQKILPIDNSRVKLNATVYDTQQLHWWLLSFRHQVIVESPKELREKLKKTLTKASKNYE